MGVDEATFWTLNPRRMKAYTRAYELKEQERDRHLWTLGQYVMSAFSVVLDHSFNKNAQSKYPEKPFLADAYLTEEELKQKQVKEVENIFSFLETIKPRK